FAHDGTGVGTTMSATVGSIDVMETLQNSSALPSITCGRVSMSTETQRSPVGVVHPASTSPASASTAASTSDSASATSATSATASASSTAASASIASCVESIAVLVSPLTPSLVPSFAASSSTPSPSPASGRPQAADVATTIGIAHRR